MGGHSTAVLHLPSGIFAGHSVPPPPHCTFGLHLHLPALPALPCHPAASYHSPLPTAPPHFLPSTFLPLHYSLHFATIPALLLLTHIFPSLSNLLSL